MPVLPEQRPSSVPVHVLGLWKGLFLKWGWGGGGGGHTHTHTLKQSKPACLVCGGGGGCLLTSPTSQPTRLPDHKGSPSAVSPQAEAPFPACGPRGVPPGRPWALGVSVATGVYRLPTASISLMQTMGSIYPLGDRIATHPHPPPLNPPPTDTQPPSPPTQ